ncbi:MAG: FAD-dependent oxidoreductase, partial [Alphaproteobacteria bacterium]
MIGGGLTGVSIARDAAGRGLSVLLVEAQDLAGATSSATSKFIHGGVLSLDKSALSAALRYLKENEILYRNASHLVRPVSCVVLEDRSGDKSVMGSALWRLKLWLYNRARVKGLFPKARKLSLENRPEDLKAVPIKFEDDARVDAYKAQEEDPKKKNVLLGGKKDKQDALPSSRDALLFSGLWVDDTRLVISHAIDAAQRGASILTYTTCEGVQARDGVWRVSLRDTRGDDRLDITASMVVNATGPWVSDFIDKAGVGKSDPDLPQLEFVRESHIILPRKYDGDHVYALRQKEGGVVYVAPYEEDYTLVGVSRAAYDPEKDGA